GLFRFATLVVQINSDSISYRWAPFGKTSNVIKTENIAFVELIKFKFSGLGYRISNRYGIMHVANGNTGILISLKNKKKYLLGVHDVSRASQALSKVLPKEQLQISIS
ncbi:MAG TPA: hypothetical protein VFF27_14380, partial [Bacteroidia bacterium]|nr:hypothetical protein [Bacteroidia bacterium]